ncbi:NUDIX hydrolase [Paenibacillus roseipurpureus]|uniref:8-oxo-dGTP diphosphatase n=1 Tax=Paenibacillus roseopurpureus TaxID=2918901 RepID=A0AA96RJH8_9BACL|nr:8-oxo-dGTP diphosphatase [Paenibacillus sp. MBLB1832]WNR43324.1 8-oxo-dGTP diphosphatase [Paenibacillus sp. MBLB1832]
MISYNICFIKRNNEILLLNRNFKPWMGCWNGVGGKIESDESPRDSMIREIYEETNMKEYDLQFKGLITWKVDESDLGGMYLYVAEVHDQFIYETPIKTDEGLLDWKPISWIIDPNNIGIAANIPITIEMILNDSSSYDHHCIYAKGKLIELISNKIDSNFETNQERTEEYLGKYVKEDSGIR